MTKVNDTIDALDAATNNAIQILTESQKTIRNQHAMVWDAAEELYLLLNVNHGNGARCQHDDCPFCEALVRWENIR